MTSTDSADEAGGEAIYSSDGLPSLAGPRAPKLMSITSNSGEDILDSNDLIEPAEALSIFTPVTKESAHAKLARLQREVAELEKEMQEDSASRELAALSSRLSGGINAQEDLMKLIHDFRANKVDNTEAGENPVRGIVYELYGGSTVSFSSAEERITKLEQILGTADAVAPGVISRLQTLEHKVNRIDSKALDDTATRAKAIRSDLEAASKARSKISSASSTADNKAISELHSQLIQLEGLSAHLPALTQRLQQLAHLHVSAANFSSRLTESEASLATIQGSLANLASSVAKMEQGIVESMMTMDANLKNVEERIS